MAYEVLARKWRPRQFDEVVGQAHVTETLKNAITSDRVAHAYLFVGPRGVGKTTIARIFAKALNAEGGSSPTPSDDSEVSIEIMNGTSLDVLEIDGASNTGVDNVRELRENVKFAPARGPYKIYIIDEVHMLSQGAFNALLKTLEEPPSHVKFIFATTEPQKLPATILSRCQRFDLRRISVQDMVDRLNEISSAESVKIDEDALLAIARGAEGGMRDALSAMDQLISFKGKDITEADVLSVFGLVARETLERLAGAVLAGDVLETLKVVAELDAAGKDLQRLNLELLEFYRNVLVFLYAGSVLESLDVPDHQVAVIEKLASGLAPAKVLRVVELLTEVEGRMRYALSKRTLFETCLIRAARASKVASIDDILQELAALKVSLGQVPVVSSEEQESAPAKKKLNPPTPPRRAAQPPAPEPAPVAEAKKESVERTQEKVPTAPPKGNDLAVLTERWHEVIDQVGRIAALAKTYLLDTTPLRVDETHVVIGFDPEFEGSMEKLDFPRNRKAVQNVLSKMLGRKVQIDFHLLDASATLPGDVKMDKVTSSGEKRVTLNTEASKTQAKARNEWLHDVSVRKTLEMFNGDIADIRE